MGEMRRAIAREEEEQTQARQVCFNAGHRGLDHRRCQAGA